MCKCCDNFKSMIMKAISNSDMGIYPAAVEGYNKEQNYKERDGFKNGWNAAVCEYGIKFKEIIWEEEGKLTSNEALFSSAGEYCFDRNDDGTWNIFLNDTWYWGCSDGEDISKEEENEVARLFKEYGRAGLMYWVYLKRGHPSEFPQEQFMIAAVKEMEELRKLMAEQHKYYFGQLKNVPQNLIDRKQVIECEFKKDPCTEKFITDLIGRSEEEVKNILTKREINFRISSRDGSYYILTQDYRINRLNLHIENGIVIKITRG